VSKLFQPEVLQIWIKKMSDEKNIEMIILLSLLNQWLSPFLSEASDYGVNSYSAEVEYFRGLARWLGQQYCYIYYVFCFVRECTCGKKCLRTRMYDLTSLHVAVALMQDVVGCPGEHRK